MPTPTPAPIPSPTAQPQQGFVYDPTTGTFFFYPGGGLSPTQYSAYTPATPGASPVPETNVFAPNPSPYGPSPTMPPNFMPLGDGTFYGLSVGATPSPTAPPAPIGGGVTTTATPPPDTSIGLPSQTPLPIGPPITVSYDPNTGLYTDTATGTTYTNSQLPMNYNLAGPGPSPAPTPSPSGTPFTAPDVFGTPPPTATPTPTAPAQTVYYDANGNLIDASTGNPAAGLADNFQVISNPLQGQPPTPQITALPGDLFPGAGGPIDITGGNINLGGPLVGPPSVDLTGGDIFLGGQPIYDTSGIPFASGDPTMTASQLGIDTGGFTAPADFTGGTPPGLSVSTGGESPQFDAYGNLIGTGISIEPDILPGNYPTPVTDLVPGATVDTPFGAPGDPFAGATTSGSTGSGVGPSAGTYAVSPTLFGGGNIGGGVPAPNPNAPGSAGISGSNASFNQVLGSLALGPAATVPAVINQGGQAYAFNPSVGGYVPIGSATGVNAVQGPFSTPGAGPQFGGQTNTGFAFATKGVLDPSSGSSPGPDINSLATPEDIGGQMGKDKVILGYKAGGFPWQPPQPIYDPAYFATHPNAIQLQGPTTGGTQVLLASGSPAQAYGSTAPSLQIFGGKQTQ